MAFKILLVTLVSVMAAMSVSELVLYESDRADAFRQLENRAEVAAARLAYNLTDPVAKSDRALIRTTISHEMKSREVLAILLEDPSGRRIAGSVLHDACSIALLDPAAVDEKLLASARVISRRPIVRDGKILGTAEVHFSDVALRETMGKRAIEGINHTVLLSIVFSTVLFLSLRRIVIRPLRTLETSVGRVARGDFDVAIPVGSADEMGRLGDSFNRMVARLRHLYEAVRESEERVRQHAAWQQRTLEEERARIAREIHDDLSQQLTALRLDLHWVGKRLLPGQEPVADKIRALIETVDETHDVVERIIRELRPQILDDLGLVPAVEWLAREFDERYGIPVDFASRPETVSPTPEQATALFRIAQEALTNVARHADAGRVRIRIREKLGVLSLAICDDGKGYDPARRSREGSHGLIGIGERVRLVGGRLRIRSRPGAGTELTVLVPTSAARPPEGASA
jgi:signal transduction histidine kinase